MVRHELTGGIAVWRVVYQVLAQEPPRSGTRLFWIVDNG
jgi:hypothetical protein